MAQNRRSILAALATISHGVTAVNTVRRVHAPIDITQWAEAELPLVEIEEPAESADTELTNMRQMVFLDIKLTVWFVLWGESPTSTSEKLETDIRNAIGNNFTLNCTAVCAWVTNVAKVDGEMPLYHFEISVRLKYYLELENV